MIKGSIFGKITRDATLTQGEYPCIHFGMSVRMQKGENNMWVDVYVRSTSDKLMDYLKSGTVAWATGDLIVSMYDSYVDHCKRIAMRLFADSVMSASMFEGTISQVNNVEQGNNSIGTSSSEMDNAPF